MNLRPRTCNLCGGHVKLIPNRFIYGRPRGSGYCYICLNCRSYVGTHRSNPRNALGVLANDEMRRLKIECHNLFDVRWCTNKQRTKQYKWLADQLGIPVEKCHFGFFDTPMLLKAKQVLEDAKNEAIQNYWITFDVP